MKSAKLCSMLILLAMVVSSCQQSNVRTGKKRPKDALVKDPSTINAQLCKAYLKKRNYNLAMLKCNKALRQDRRNPDAHKWIAILHQNLGQDKLARKHFKKAVTLAPEDSATHNNYGVFLLQQREFIKAERQFLLAAGNPLYGARFLAYSNAGLCMLGAKNNKKAEIYFRKALRINSGFAPALYNLARLSFNSGRFVSANKYMQRWQERNRWNAAALWLNIRIAWKLAQEGRAASLGLLLRNRYPDSVQAKLYQKRERSRRIGL